MQQRSYTGIPIGYGRGRRCSRRDTRWLYSRCTRRRQWRRWVVMHEAKAMEEMSCDARGKGDGGDGLRCTGRRRWRGWVAIHGAKVTEGMGCDARGKGDGRDGLQCTGRRIWGNWGFQNLGKE
ncbi:hypothetical protein PVK06_024817 [Gossypium arboreum]|uniref:Uncharacterized protein n=1 Tax=Gossypium arboreum TaxID=29729 RepID=A0ABR0PFE2_GOSAR|nr:hypothetical protein PVK06_024817 [Gossypium arboreum]